HRLTDQAVKPTGQLDVDMAEVNAILNRRAKDATVFGTIGIEPGPEGLPAVHVPRPTPAWIPRPDGQPLRTGLVLWESNYVPPPTVRAVWHNSELVSGYVNSVHQLMANLEANGHRI